MISNVNRNLRDRNDQDNYATYSFISSWNNNYNSWKLAKNLNKVLIKYEDLENDIEKSFTKIIEFTNKIMRKDNKINIKKLKRSIETTQFDLLKKKKKMKVLMRQYILLIMEKPSLSLIWARIMTIENF